MPPNLVSAPPPGSGGPYEGPYSAPPDGGPGWGMPLQEAGAPQYQQMANLGFGSPWGYGYG